MQMSVRCRFVQGSNTFFAPDLATYWVEVVEQVIRATGWDIPLTINVCLLGLLPRNSKEEPSRCFSVLGLTMGKRCIATRWMSNRAPTREKWERDLKEWANAEEEHLRRTRKDDKLPEVLLAWG
ncbi:hypothetical protein NDU88_005708 [Pleurodeles waltl]|uniref:Uncharacterized protein n=1 Tax=Pleurodeles waltl TaxID=8319 RepID=A0AAV7SMD9_PLEWA|nr:hypothetical protein NDU88_005708 [Pleurodeles waltl]